MTLLSFIHIQSCKNSLQQFSADFKLKKLSPKYGNNALATSILGSLFLVSTAAVAEPLTFNLQAQPLSSALKAYGKTVGITIAVDGKLISGKNSPALNGRYEPDQALRALLKGSGLKSVTEDGYVIIQQASAKDLNVELKEVTVKAKRLQNIGPLPGLSLTKDQIAGNIQSISAKEIKEAHSLSLSELLNSKLQSVNVNDYQGNPFQMDITYRGFTAGPQLGTPQGLSVFLDGIRVNEPFGDIVNWDMIPMNALASFDVFPGSNPLFGLNTLGGALSMKTKSGFDSPGFSADILAGSYGRKQLQASGGWNNGTLAAFGAVNLFMEEGWRDNSPSQVNQAFGKLDWQGDRASLSLTSLAVVNKLVGNGTVPQEIYNQDYKAIFTSPDETKNKLLQFQISGAFDVTDNINITGQVYNRDSNRKSNTGDIIDLDTFYQPDETHKPLATRRARPGENITCALGDRNGDGIPNYYVIKESDQFPAFIANPDAFFFKFADKSLFEFDKPLPIQLQNKLKEAFSNKAAGNFAFDLNDDSISALGNSSEFINTPFLGNSYTDPADGIRYVYFAAEPINLDSGCLQYTNKTTEEQIGDRGDLLDLPADNTNNPGRFRNGAYLNTNGLPGSGVVAGTPTAIITKSNIEQSGQGAALQLNFNFEKHKAMIGASLDRAKATYVGKQRYGLLDDNRNVYNDPNEIGEEFYAADHDITINDFAGKSSTRSVYASETWSPIQTLNLSASARYNYSNTKNTIAPKVADTGLYRLLNQYLQYTVCPGDDLSQCAYSLNTPIDYDVYQRDVLGYKNLIGNILGQNGNLIDKKATEKFSYHSLNPSIGATWQAKPNLNLYANWNQGTRVPSVIELGCAYDGTLVPSGKDQQGNQLFTPRSVAEGRGCSLPSALSGDPYLPQVKARTAEVGARGKFKDFLEWNISAYRTEVNDDIYLTSATPELSFFQSIGDTRRQGIEFGLAGEYGKSDFRINYSLTEATFQSNFKTISPNNSSRGIEQTNLNMIDVKPGNVMPGVPFNNMNFNWGYKVNKDLKVNFTLVGHSGSFLRGNENNAHTPTQGRPYTLAGGQTLLLPDNNYSGRAPGYAVLNFSSRYDLGKGWAFGARVNNVLDKQYYTAGRLGTNPFAPSRQGVIGPGGFNYNSNEWIPSQFISAGAPRGLWMTLSYDYDAAKRSDPPSTSQLIIEPDRTLMTANNAPTADELAVIQQIDAVKALPILKRNLSAAQIAQLEVTSSVEEWRKALIQGNTDAYINSYSSGYAPVGISHNNWVEAKKLELATASLKTAEVSNLVVAPQGKRMVAVFTQKSDNGKQLAASRKMMTFEQKNGKWQIIRETIVPSAYMDNMAINPNAKSAVIKESTADEKVTFTFNNHEVLTIDQADKPKLNESAQKLIKESTKTASNKTNANAMEAN